MPLCWESSKSVLTTTLLAVFFEARYRRQATSISPGHLHFSWSTREIMTTSSVSAEHVPDESFTAARAKSRRSADGSTDSNGSEGIAKEHQLASLSSLTGKAHLQRACVQCKPTFRKASYCCKSCGSEFVLWGPTTGRLCYHNHIQGRKE